MFKWEADAVKDFRTESQGLICHSCSDVYFGNVSSLTASCVVWVGCSRSFACMSRSMIKLLSYDLDIGPMHLTPFTLSYLYCVFTWVCSPSIWDEKYGTWSVLKLCSCLFCHNVIPIRTRITLTTKLNRGVLQQRKHSKSVCFPSFVAEVAVILECDSATFG